MIANKIKSNNSVTILFIILFLIAPSLLQGDESEIIVLLTNSSCIYEKPDKKSKCIRNIKKGEQLSIVQYNLEYKNEDSTQYWTKIQDKNQIFYIPSESLSEPNQFVSFPSNFNKKVQYINATSLNLRKIPDLSGDVVQLIGKGEQITLISKSNKKFTVNGIENYWAKIESKSKKIGYVFAAYLSDEIVIPDEDLEFDYSGENIEGFIKIKNTVANTYRVPSVSQGYKDAEYCGDNKINFLDKNFDLNKIEPYEKKEADRYVRVTKVKKVIDKEYFLINWLDNDSFDGGTIQNCYSFWIKKDDTEFFPTSFTKWQRNKYGSKFESSFLDYIEKQNVHLKKSNITSIKTINKSIEFFVFEKHSYGDTFKTNRDINFNVIMKKDGKYETLFENHNFDKISLHDFNNDGEDEILVVDQFSEIITTSIFQIVENKLKAILVMDFQAYEDKNCIIDATLQTKVLRIQRKVKSSIEKNNFPCSPIFEKDTVKVNQTPNSFKIENGFVTPL